MSEKLVLLSIEEEDRLLLNTELTNLHSYLFCIEHSSSSTEREMWREKYAEAAVKYDATVRRVYLKLTEEILTLLKNYLREVK